MKITKVMIFTLIIGNIACQSVPNCERAVPVYDSDVAMQARGARCASPFSTPEIVNGVFVCKCNDKK